MLLPILETTIYSRVSLPTRAPHTPPAPPRPCIKRERDRPPANFGAQGTQRAQRRRDLLRGFPQPALQCRLYPFCVPSRHRRRENRGSGLRVLRRFAGTRAPRSGAWGCWGLVPPSPAPEPCRGLATPPALRLLLGGRAQCGCEDLYWGPDRRCSSHTEGTRAPRTRPLRRAPRPTRCPLYFEAFIL